MKNEIINSETITQENQKLNSFLPLEITTGFLEKTGSLVADFFIGSSPTSILAVTK